MPSNKTQVGLDAMLKAIDNIVSAKIENAKFDKTYRGKVIEQASTGVYTVEVLGKNYNLSYSGTLSANDIVRVKAPLGNFSDIYIESKV